MTSHDPIPPEAPVTQTVLSFVTGMVLLVTAITSKNSINSNHYQRQWWTTVTNKKYQRRHYDTVTNVAN